MRYICKLMIHLKVRCGCMLRVMTSLSVGMIGLRRHEGMEILSVFIWGQGEGVNVCVSVSVCVRLCMRV